ncbi:MAG: YabP/YqfC family sporulation protein [Anaerovoracaceae bacterium]|nr:YabP/YqfC family sporulation protein [Anaerovoracaceae bacterium]
MENHKVTIDNRVKTTITDILEIDSFDEAEVRATLKQGAMIIKGEKLNIQTLDLQEGIAVIAGTINSLMYVKVREKGEKGIFAKIMK